MADRATITRRALMGAVPVLALGAVKAAQVEAAAAPVEAVDQQPLQQDDMPTLEGAWIKGRDDLDLWVLVEQTDKLHDRLYRLHTGQLVRLDTMAGKVWDGVEWTPYEPEAMRPLIQGYVWLGMEHAYGRWHRRDVPDLL